MKAIYFKTVQEFQEYSKKNGNLGYVLFSTNEKLIELAKVVSQDTVLCSTSGEYTPEGYKENVVTGFEFDKDEAEIVEILYPPVKSLNNLKRAYEKVRRNHNAFALLLCDGLSGMEETISTTFYFADDNFKIIGGSAGDYLKFKETPIYIGNKRVHSVSVFFNSKRKTQILKENIYEPLGVRMLITEADPIKRIVYSINAKPASSEYANALNISEAELGGSFINNPLGKLKKNDLFIASPMKINGDKSISFYCQILPNTFVEVLKPGNPLEVIRKTLTTAEFRPSFVLAINCILRSIKFNQEGNWKNIDKELTGFCKNISGFISYGEQFYKNNLNQTMVMLLVE